jgi:GNAT superfamily N-acetyltransferase
VYAAVPATERAEIAALIDLWDAAGYDLSERLGAAQFRAGGAFAFSCRSVPAIELNRALGVATPDELDAVEEFYRAQGSQFWVSPLPGSDLDAELERRGYVSGYRWMKFSRAAGAAGTVTTEFEIAEVGADRALDFSATACAGYGFPEFFVPWPARLPGRDGWTCVVSYDRGRPVGTGALFVRGDAGWLGMAATLPEARGRGSQTAILAHRIERAAELGCSLLVTETGERLPDSPFGSYRNILRAGFEERYLRPNYRPP